MGSSPTAQAGVIFRDSYVLQSPNRIPTQPQTSPGFTHIPCSSHSHHLKGGSWGAGRVLEFVHVSWVNVSWVLNATPGKERRKPCRAWPREEGRGFHGRARFMASLIQIYFLLSLLPFIAQTNQVYTLGNVFKNTSKSHWELNILALILQSVSDNNSTVTTCSAIAGARNLNSAFTFQRWHSLSYPSVSQM